MKPFTLGDFREMTKHLDDSTPMLRVNPVGMGTNKYEGDNIEIGEALLADDGVSYTKEYESIIGKSVKVEAILIYEG